MIEIHGLNKTTLLDFPGHIAATVFLGRCNFRCPFCQNGSLVTRPDSQPVIPEEEVLSFFRKRRGILEGVCVTGGEPTLSKDLPQFLNAIKEMGYLVKLDTNGYRPETLAGLCREGLVDMVAMDIKSSREHYEKACGLPGMDLSAIEASAQFLMNGKIPYEFRTTVVRELHTEQDFISIGKWLAGCRAYFLQSYRDSEDVLVPGFSSYPPETLVSFQKLLQKTIPHVGIRGVDVPD